MRFEVLEHTGDVGIRYFGKTLEELFSNAVSGTAFLIGDPGEKCRKKRYELSFKWTDHIDLMYQLLDRIIYLFEVDEYLCDTLVSMDLVDNENTKLVIDACKVTSKFQYKYIMKAPTYHQMEINPKEGYGVQIFDI